LGISYPGPGSARSSPRAGPAAESRGDLAALAIGNATAERPSYPGGISNTGFRRRRGRRRITTAIGPASQTGGQPWAYQRSQQGRPGDVQGTTRFLARRGAEPWAWPRIRANNHTTPQAVFPLWADSARPGHVRQQRSNVARRYVDLPRGNDGRDGWSCPTWPSDFTGTGSARVHVYERARTWTSLIRSRTTRWCGTPRARRSPTPGAAH